MKWRTQYMGSLSEEDLNYGEYNEVEDYDDRTPGNYSSYSDSDSEYEELKGEVRIGRHNKNNQLGVKCKVREMEVQGRSMNRINVEMMDLTPSETVSQGVSGQVKGSFAKQMLQMKKRKDKKNRATTEQVLDPRTRVMLFKMINTQYFDEICGCISTGKEANVYYASKQVENIYTEYAVKIYKTSILIFKDRERYVNGEFRFRKGYCKSNPRKMVTLWAEKEMRNLRRIQVSGIPAPSPILCKSHILLMTFIGKGGIPAPRLKDALHIDIQGYYDCYLQILNIMRKLFHECKLVHADLSEYNILYYDRVLYLIDVSQSVEHDHPMSLHFLRRDCVNINNYFAKKGVTVLSTRDIFDFVTMDSIPGDLDDWITMKMDQGKGEGGEETVETVEKKLKDILEDNVFKEINIPRTLFEIDTEKPDYKEKKVYIYIIYIINI